MTANETRTPTLTAKGRAQRERIVRAAAELIYVHGVHGTNNELVRATTGISGSQLSHYFPDKDSLVRAVLSWRAESMMGLHDDPPRGDLDSIPALHAWAEGYLNRTDVLDGGCSFGSLAAEVMKTDLDVHDAITAGFDRWKRQFTTALHTMRDRGDLRADTDIDRLAHTLMAAFQGGMLLAQAAHHTAPLRDALISAIDYVATHAPTTRPQQR